MHYLSYDNIFATKPKINSLYHLNFTERRGEGLGKMVDLVGFFKPRNSL